MVFINESVMVFINESDLIGKFVIHMTANLTGSEFLTYLTIFLTLILFTQIFKLPLEYTIAITLPLALVLAAAFTSFVPVVSLFALYTAFFLAKKFT
jgi:hypothetical protein